MCVRCVCVCVVCGWCALCVCVCCVWVVGCLGVRCVCVCVLCAGALSRAVAGVAVGS